MKKHLFGLFAALLGTAAMAAPDAPPVLPPNIAVDINAPGAVRAEIAISIPSLKEEKRYTLAVSDGALVGGIYVPPGKEIKVSVTALDARGETLYWGSGNVSVSEKFNPQIDIALTGKEIKEPLSAKFGTNRLALNLAANEGDGLMIEATLFDAAGKHLTINPEDMIWRGMPEKFEVLPYSCFNNSLCFEMPDLTVYEAMMACIADVVCSHTKPKDSRGPYLQVAVGRNHTCALTVKNEIVCWGDNRAGQLRSTPTTCTTGTRASDCSAVPLPVVCGTGEVCKFQSLAAGAEMTCAVDTDGKAWCWGRHGDHATGEISTQAVEINTEIVAVDADDHKVLFTSIDTDLIDSCAISTTHELYCWSNSTTSLDDSDVHKKGTLYESVSVGKRHACARTVGGKVDCFGSDFDGQVTGTFPPGGPINPVLEQIFKRGAHVTSAGATSSCAQDLSNNTICWGSPEANAPWATPPTGGWIALWQSYANTVSSNSHMCGVGPGTFFDCTRICATALGGDLFCGNWLWSGGSPSQLTMLRDPPSDYLVSWTQVDVGPNNVCAVTRQRDIWCFGVNDFGQFGTGTTSTRRTQEPTIPAVRFNNEILTLEIPWRVYP